MDFRKLCMLVTMIFILGLSSSTKASDDINSSGPEKEERIIDGNCNIWTIAVRYLRHIYVCLYMII